MHPFEQKTAHFIAENSLLSASGRYLIALSGGADSVALLRVLKVLGYVLEAVHCNFHLRGSESERDASFCEALCKCQNIPFHRVDFNTLEYAETHRVSVEMAARTLRYNYFEHLRQEVDADAVCVAHHRDDVAETVIMNLVRGAGLRGLHGILPVNGKIIRPLLSVSRSEIVSYLEYLQQDYVEDSTNKMADFTRNKIRLQVLPLLREINSHASENIARTAGFLREAEQIVEDSICDFCRDMGADGAEILVEQLLNTPSPSTYLYYILEKYSFSSAETAQILASLHHESGAVWYSPTHVLLLDRGRLLVEKRRVEGENGSLSLSGLGEYMCPDGRKLTLSAFPFSAELLALREQNKVVMDADKTVFPLTVRRCQPGDRIALAGLSGTKLVSDYLTDRKVSLFDKSRQLVMTDANGRVVWLIGHRLNRHVYASAGTAELIVATISD
ncbi:MAG: tRNA lysidine(34) synthetase TilS [Prevotella sp.]|nr:tRNA lysidine(34) synthetase TilS [Prevotella sp.]